MNVDASMNSFPEIATTVTAEGPIDVQIRLDCQTPGQFLDRHSADVSRGGIFIRTRQVLAVGSAIRLDLRLREGALLIAGEGTVFWTREPDPARAESECGMGIRFSRLTPESQQMLSLLLADKTERERLGARAGFDDDDRTVVATEADVRAITGDDRNQRSSRHVVSVRPAPVAEAVIAEALPSPSIEETPEKTAEVKPLPRRPSGKLDIGITLAGLMMIAAWFALAARPTIASSQRYARQAVPTATSASASR